MFLPFYHFLYLSYLLIFNPASSPPFPHSPSSSTSTPPPPSPPSSLFFSASPEPSAPPQDIKCSSTSSTTLRVSWRPPPPESQNGALVGYRVHYQPVAPSEGGSVDEDFLQEAATSAGEEQMVLQWLEKWTQYRISVSASTVVGPGPESEPLICRTDEDGTVLCFLRFSILSIHSWTAKHLEMLGVRSRILTFEIWTFVHTLTSFLSKYGPTDLDLLSMSIKHVLLTECPHIFNHYIPNELNIREQVKLLRKVKMWARRSPSESLTDGWHRLLSYTMRVTSITCDTSPQWSWRGRRPRRGGRGCKSAAGLDGGDFRK